MRKILIAALAAFSFAASAGAAAPAPKGPVREALVVDCVLWTLRWDKLAAERVCGDGPVPDLPQPARDAHGVAAIARGNGELWYAAAWYPHVSTRYRIRSTGGRALPEFELKLDEHLIGFTAYGGEVTVLTNRNLMVPSPDGQSWVMRPLPTPLQTARGEYFIASPLSDGHDLYVGRDAGEFGHELYRIDARTGAIKLVTTDIARCGWNRSYVCTPGGRVIADPFHRGCVIASATTDLLRLCVDRPPQLIERSEEHTSELQSH